ncbi:MAG: DNA-processing protein DprA [Formosimonas sp.]
MITAPDELHAWLRLMSSKGVGDVTAQTLLKHFGLPQQILNASYASLTRVVSANVTDALTAPDSAEFKALLERTVAWLNEAGNAVITLACPEYPAALLNIADPPTVLYAKGRLDLLNSPINLAIVGSRNASVQGVSNAEVFARELAAGGMTIVSGLALGIDAAAHRGALDAAHRSASTIAIIGTGCDIIYPARNRDLAHRIAANGLILSEFPLGTKALQNHFPRRNRIISGLSQGVLVIEAALQSGSLITARQAAEQNREVFAIPGSIHSPLARGCHALIRQGAKLVESAQDILEELHIPAAPAVAAPAPEVTHSDAAQSILTALGFDPCNLDDLARRTQMSIADLSGELMLLELAGQVEKHAGNIYSRCV